MDPFSLDHIILPSPTLYYVKKLAEPLLRNSAMVVGLIRLELMTSCLSGTRSNHLSYRPKIIKDISEEKKKWKSKGSCRTFTYWLTTFNLA